MKKLMALLLATVLVLSMAACTSTPTEGAPTDEPGVTNEGDEGNKDAETPADNDGDVKVAFITQSLSNASQAYAWTQFQKYADDYGFTVTVFEEDYDAQNGVAAIGTCIAQDYTAICINPTDPSAIIPALMEAKEAGIIIGMYSSEIPAGNEQYRDFMCGTDDFMAGEVAAQTLMEAFPNGAKVVEVGGQSGHDAQIKRHDGFMDTIASNITVLDSRDCEAWASEDAMAIMEDFIVQYGDEIEVAYCHWDVGATGIIEALKNAGMDDVYVIGVDGCSVGYDQVNEGMQALCIGQSFSQMTLDSFDNITKIMNGEEFEEVVWTALDIVTIDTIDDFPYPEW